MPNFEAFKGYIGSMDHRGIKHARLPPHKAKNTGNCAIAIHCQILISPPLISTATHLFRKVAYILLFELANILCFLPQCYIATVGFAWRLLTQKATP